MDENDGLNLCPVCGAYWGCECLNDILEAEPGYVDRNVWEQLIQRVPKNISGDWTGGGTSDVWSNTDQVADATYATFPPLT